jgi:hypothetical protein
MLMMGQTMIRQGQDKIDPDAVGNVFFADEKWIMRTVVIFSNSIRCERRASERLSERRASDASALSDSDEQL